MTTIYKAYKQRIAAAADSNLLAEDLNNWARHIRQGAAGWCVIEQKREAARQAHSLEAIATLLNNGTPQKHVQQTLEHVMQYKNPWKWGRRGMSQGGARDGVGEQHKKPTEQLGSNSPTSLQSPRNDMSMENAPL